MRMLRVERVSWIGFYVAKMRMRMRSKSEPQLIGILLWVD